MPRARAQIKAESPARNPDATHYRVREGHVIVVDDVTSERMRGVRQRGTSPELVVRRVLSDLGQRYRLGNRDLPGSPDLANRRQRWVIFVHGCYWHRHGCKATTTPTRNRDFWQAKFERNVARDERSAAELQRLGYRVYVIWECQTKRGSEPVLRQLAAFFAAALMDPAQRPRQLSRGGRAARARSPSRPTG